MKNGANEFKTLKNNGNLDKTLCFQQNWLPKNVFRHKIPPWKATFFVHILGSGDQRDASCLLFLNIFFEPIHLVSADLGAILQPVLEPSLLSICRSGCSKSAWAQSPEAFRGAYSLSTHSRAQISDLSLLQISRAQISLLTAPESDQGSELWRPRTDPTPCPSTPPPARLGYLSSPWNCIFWANPF